MRRLAAAAPWALPIAFTAAVLAANAVNRSGGGRAPMELSGREIYYYQANQAEGTTRLVLSWTHDLPGGALGTRDLPVRGFAVLGLGDAAGPGSRLVVVETGKDADALAAKYPDGRRHIITAAVLRGGRVVNIEPAQILVPPRLAARLPGAARRSPGAALAAVTVTVQYGRLWQPWVVDVTGQD